jgi:hypothetical protein
MMLLWQNRVQIHDYGIYAPGLWLPGKGIIEIGRIEFLCPICRRLANTLLPVVHQASLSRMVQASAGTGSQGVVAVVTLAECIRVKLHLFLSFLLKKHFLVTKFHFVAITVV